MEWYWYVIIIVVVLILILIDWEGLIKGKSSDDIVERGLNRIKKLGDCCKRLFKGR